MLGLLSKKVIRMMSFLPKLTDTGIGFLHALYTKSLSRVLCLRKTETNNIFDI